MATKTGRNGKVVFWLLVLRLGLCHNTSSDAFRLIKEVVQKHSILGTVYPDEGQMVAVNLTFFPIHILSISEREQRFTLSGWFGVSWIDANLKWAPHEYGNITRAYVAYDDIWKPDLTVINGVDSLQSVAGSHSALTVSANGHVQWLPGNVYSITCKMDLSSFPFDRQDCFITVSTWTYTSDTVLLFPQSPSIRMDSWRENYEWDMHSRRCDMYNRTSDGKLYPFVEYHLLLTRRSRFYVLKFLAPIVILSLLNAFVFCVPPQSGEKVSLAVSTMLSLTVFLAYLSDITPSNSDTVPEVAIFVFLHLTLAGMGVICNILLLKLYFYSMQQSHKRRRRMTEKLWTTSVEEQDDPTSTQRQKNITQSLWTSDVNENVDEEASSFPARRPRTILDSRIFCRNSMVSGQNDVVYPSQSGRPQYVFRDVTKDRYLSTEINSKNAQINSSRFSNTNNIINLESNRTDENRFSWHFGHLRDFLFCCKHMNVGKCLVSQCLVDRLGNICFVLFLLSSVLVSALFFIRNV